MMIWWWCAMFSLDRRPFFQALYTRQKGTFADYCWKHVKNMNKIPSTFQGLQLFTQNLPGPSLLQRGTWPIWWAGTHKLLRLTNKLLSKFKWLESLALESGSGICFPFPAYIKYFCNYVIIFHFRSFTVNLLVWQVIEKKSAASGASWNFCGLQALRLVLEECLHWWQGVHLLPLVSGPEGPWEPAASSRWRREKWREKGGYDGMRERVPFTSVTHWLKKNVRKCTQENLSWFCWGFLWFLDFLAVHLSSLADKHEPHRTKCEEKASGAR